MEGISRVGGIHRRGKKERKGKELVLTVRDEVVIAGLTLPRKAKGEGRENDWD